MFKNKYFLIGGVIVVIAVLIVMAVLRSGGGTSEATPTPPESNLLNQDGLTPQATPTGSDAVTATLEAIPVAGASCGSDCMWSSTCVVGQYTTEEWSGLGLTKVHPNSCIPLDPLRWNIRPDDPFAGMPCSLGSTTCVWSRQCVDKGLVSAVKNGLAPVFPNSCTPATP